MSLPLIALTIGSYLVLLMAGDTVFVENGTYVGFDIRNASGTAGAYFQIHFLSGHSCIGKKAVINN